MSSTITVRYWGGLGNVLFEIAAAIVYAVKHNRKFIFEHYPSLPNLDNYSPESVGISNKQFADSLKEFSEEEIEKNIPFPENQNIKLTGFYQKYKLFDSMKAQIFEIMGFPAIRSTVLQKITGPEFCERGLFSRHCQVTSSENHSDLPGKNTVSLHIRRGDYEGLKCYFLLLNKYYYKNALLQIAEKLDTSVPINILCFYETKSKVSASGVIDALKEDPDLKHLPFEYHHFNDIINTPVTDIEEMAIMSHCDHHIIANSTYSWWAAYINTCPDKIVCYPDQFYNHQLYYLSIKGMQVDVWTSIPAWDPNEYRCDCYRK